MAEDKKVLLKITNLKQYFHLKKKGMYVKANDGIDVEIYEGETLGLVGESGCGKSTFGRTILELYPQTDGRTMYYGRTIDEIAPKYIEKTIRHLPKLREKARKLQTKADEAQKAFDEAKPEEQAAKNEALRQAKRDADAALWNIANVFGGFITLDDTKPAQDANEAIQKLSVKLRNLNRVRAKHQTILEDLEYLE